MRKHLRGWVVAVTAAVLCAGCATGPATPPGHETALPFQLARVQEQTRDGVIVHLVIPTEEEVAAHFGAGFAEHGIQPIWLRITNGADADLWFLPIAVDADYFSADEAALVAGAKLADEQGAALRDALRARALPLFHAAGATPSVFISMPAHPQDESPSSFCQSCCLVEPMRSSRRRA